MLFTVKSDEVMRKLQDYSTIFKKSRGIEDRKEYTSFRLFFK